VNSLWDWEASSYGNHQETWLQKSMCKVGAKNLPSNTKLPKKCVQTFSGTVRKMEMPFSE
jgi:hypothetical protein